MEYEFPELGYLSFSNFVRKTKSVILMLMWFVNEFFLSDHGHVFAFIL